MCEDIKKSRKKTATGYKFVLADAHGNYWSPFTGIKYEVGKVPPRPIEKNIYCMQGVWFNWEQDKLRLTGVIPTINDAIYKAEYYILESKIPKGYTLQIIKVNVSNVYSGRFDAIDIYLGDTIESIKYVTNVFKER